MIWARSERRDSTLSGYADAMRVENVPFESLDAREIRRRWPAFRVGDDVHGLYQAEGGIVAAERATAAHQRLARAHGATLYDNAPVESVRDDGATITVQ